MVRFTSTAAKNWYRNYSRRWNRCKECPLHLNANKHVLLRGTLPSDILFIGEAPGFSEDATGIPFINPDGAGKVLDQLLLATANALDSDGTPGSTAAVEFSYVIGNICCCLPLHTPGNPSAGVRPPLPQEIEACRPHLEELLYEFKFKGVVLMGRVAQTHAAPIFDPNTSMFGNTRVLSIYHPAYLKRRGGNSPKNLEFKNTVIQLRDFVRQVQLSSPSQGDTHAGAQPESW